MGSSRPSPGGRGEGAAAAGALLVVLLGVGQAWGQACRPILRYSFQPDCYRPSTAAACDKRLTGERLDLGPQIAVWLESMDGTKFVDTLMVTKLTAHHGLGNRPGNWRLPSSPKFPYGKRRMALPLWAYTRGKLYDAVVMQDGDMKEFWLGFHESISSPDPYYCRPMSLKEIDVDAVTCPTAVFNSAKGKFSSSEKSYYPPRNDLTNFTDRDCDSSSSSTCAISARRYADINDLDAIAAATPPYGQVFRGLWDVPVDLPEGEYALLVEVSKEFDSNPFHSYTAHQDLQLPDSGLRNNFGQPSVLYRVPIQIDRAATHQSAATEIVAFGDWDGETGSRHVPDPTITDAPGSGRARLLVITEPSAVGGEPVSGRVHAVTEPSRNCDSVNKGTGEVTGIDVPAASILPTEAELTFIEASDGGQVVQQYEIRYREGLSMTSEAFKEATPTTPVTPSTPGAKVQVKIAQLKPETQYVVGVRARGCCIGEGPLAMTTFRTAKMKFKQISGCFIATAAFGSELQKEVDVMRRFRDQARSGSALAAAAVDLYERSSPPLAALLRESETGRAVVREILAPFASLLGTADAKEPRQGPFLNRFH